MCAHFLYGSVAAFLASARTYWFTLLVVWATYLWPSSQVSREVWQWVAK
jgi:hypothetical protein